MDFNKDLLVALQGLDVSSEVVPIMLRHRKFDLFKWALEQRSIIVYDGIVDDILAANAIDFMKALHGHTGNDPMYADVAAKARDKNLTHILRWARNAMPWCMCGDECTCSPDNMKKDKPSNPVSFHEKMKDISDFLHKTITDLQQELENIDLYIDEA